MPLSILNNSESFKFVEGEFDLCFFNITAKLSKITEYIKNILPIVYYAKVNIPLGGSALYTKLSKTNK